ncbi:MAG: copper-binding protein [Reyranella sp.]|uniref:copper-binding protein n=1 Tax=Reyranella sp. TaxID=1929291 RepID=UPI0027321DAF|nr:copper-binding protein [Reyranella sp.]MDP1965293.1 copper-binding protein [Reyranella sp.]MDP2372272.1 copper-binding protein [Reyranella sp.]
MLAATIGLAGSVVAAETMADPWPHSYDDEMSGSVQPIASMPLAFGRVVAVDRTGSKITLDYPAIPQLLLEGGTRNFAVQDAALLTGLTPGDKVRFEVEREGREFIVKRIVNSN